MPKLFFDANQRETTNGIIYSLLKSTVYSAARKCLVHWSSLTGQATDESQWWVNNPLLLTTKPVLTVHRLENRTKAFCTKLNMKL